jgi:hypothetical protein
MNGLKNNKEKALLAAKSGKNMQPFLKKYGLMPKLMKCYTS